MAISLAMHPSFDELILSLEKLAALLRIASSADITEQKAQIVFHYFWVAENILEKARKACEGLAEMVIFCEENHKIQL